MTNQEDIKKLNEIKSKEFNKINAKSSFLKNTDLCLLNPKFIKKTRNYI